MVQQGVNRAFRLKQIWFTASYAFLYVVQEIFAELDLDDDTDALSELRQTQLLQSGKGKKRKAEEEAEPVVQKQEVATPSQKVNVDEDNSDSDDDDSSDDEK